MLMTPLLLPSFLLPQLILRRWVVGGVGVLVSAGREGVSDISEVSLMCVMQLLSLGL